MNTRIQKGGEEPLEGRAARENGEVKNIECHAGEKGIKRGKDESTIIFVNIPAR